MARREIEADDAERLHSRRVLPSVDGRVFGATNNIPL